MIEKSLALFDQVSPDNRKDRLKPLPQSSYKETSFRSIETPDGR
jgi:hypothetical protein